ncbi:DUF1507 family protein [Enterococcus sp. LJL98]
MASSSEEKARTLLEEEANRIRLLIKNQKNSLCIAHCKAFEEVVDTQMYGLSRQIAFAISLGAITNTEGQQLLSDLERDLNRMYHEVFSERKENETGKEV